MGPIYSLEDVIDMLRRRMKVILAFTVLGAVAAVFMALSTPHAYNSTEVIEIQRGKIAGELTSPVIEGSSGRRLQSVQHQLTSRGTLLEIVDKYDIYADVPAMTPTEKAQALREAIVITGVPAVSEGPTSVGELSVLSISVTLDTPQLAQWVAREMSARTIELYASRRIEEARTTLQFFVEQEDEVFDKIQQLEAEIAAYRATQELSLPGGVEFRQSQIEALSAAILDIEREKIAVQRELDQVDREGQREVTFQRAVRALETQQLNLDEQRALLIARLDAISATIETSPEVERQLEAFDRQMDLLREQLRVVTSNRAAAEVGLTLESERKAEQLVVIEPASLADYPSTPSRTRNVILGTAGATVLGMLVAFLLELRHPIIRSAAQMERETGIVPVLTLPDVTVSRGDPSRLHRIWAWFNGKVAISASQSKTDDMRAGS